MVMLLRRQYFSRSPGEAEMDARPFADHERLAAERAQFALDVALHRPHGRHDDDDGKNADQHAEQRQRRTQFVRRNGAPMAIE